MAPILRRMKGSRTRPGDMAVPASGASAVCWPPNLPGIAAAGLCGCVLGGVEGVAEQEAADDLEDAHDDEPDPEQDGQDVE